MHRIKGIDPYQDTLKKIRTVAPISGRVLDTCTGLGYTAIEAAQTAREVVTIELDPTVLEVARLNPWSRELFDNPRIQQIVGDVVGLCPPPGPPVFLLAQSVAGSHQDPAGLLRVRHLYVGDLVPHHNAASQVDVQIARGLQEHSRPRLTATAVGPVRRLSGLGMMRAVVDRV